LLLGSRALFTAVQTQKEAIEKKAAGEASPSRSSSSALSLGLAQPVEEDDEQLSEHEALAFAQEGESMLREFTSMLDGIREAEKRILEISRMQVLMETQVLHQATQIDELSSQSVEYALSLTLTLSLTHSLTHTHTNTLVETELINVFSLTDFLFFFLVRVSENIKKGNQTLMDSKKLMSSSRKYILIFLLIASLALLFLDWFG